MIFTQVGSEHIYLRVIPAKIPTGHLCRNRKGSSYNHRVFNSR